jgi:predicted transcriptional regulator
MASIRRRREIVIPKTTSGDCSRAFMALRLKRQVSQREVAKKAGLSVGFVCDFENGRRGISVEHWCDLIKALGECPARVLRQALSQ